jgi:hypothetical protein
MRLLAQGLGHGRQLVTSARDGVLAPRAEGRWIEGRKIAAHRRVGSARWRNWDDALTRFISAVRGKAEPIIQGLGLRVVRQACCVSRGCKTLAGRGDRNR